MLLFLGKKKQQIDIVLRMCDPPCNTHFFIIIIIILFFFFRVEKDANVFAITSSSSSSHLPHHSEREGERERDNWHKNAPASKTDWNGHPSPHSHHHMWAEYERAKEKKNIIAKSDCSSSQQLRHLFWACPYFSN